MKKFSLLFLVMAFSLVCACAPRLRANITGYLDKSSPSPISPSSKICVIENEQAVNPLLEKEVKTKITALLEGRGYSSASIDDADYFMFFGYGIGGPREVTINIPKVRYGFAKIGKYSLHSVGVRQGTARRQLHDRWLILNVIDGRKYRETGKTETVWVGESNSAGTSSDMRMVINYMLVTVFEYFAKDTAEQLTVDIMKDDLRAKDLQTAGRPPIAPAQPAAPAPPGQAAND